MTNPTRRLLALAIMSGLIHGSLAIATRAEFDASRLIASFFVAQAILFILYAFAIRSVVDADPEPRTTRWCWTVIIGGAIAFRILAMSGDPILENDHHRYLWDGKVASAGISPFFYPPDSVFLEDLRDENWSQVAYRSVPTIYPPVSQFLFAASWAVGGAELWIWKLFVLFWDVGTIGLLVVLLRRLKLPAACVLIYAWNPLVIKEFSNSAHVDAVAVFWTTAFIAAWVSNRRSWSAVCLGLAIASKLYPLVLVPLTLCSFRVRDHAIWIATVAACYLPFIDAGELLFEGLSVYLGQWEFNDSVFVVLRAIADLWSPENSYTVAKCAAGGAVLAIGLAQSRCVRNDASRIPRAVLIVLGSLCILGPTVDPWYLTWIVPVLCIHPNRAWLVLGATATFSYAYWLYETDLWWIRPLEYGPFFILLVAPCFPFLIRFIRSSDSEKEATCALR